MHRLSRKQVREVDRRAIEVLGIPGIVLMENAAIGAVQAIIELLEEEHQMGLGDARVAIVCGGGNNGGDGFAIARHLSIVGCGLTVYLLKNPMEITGDAAINLKIIQNMGLAIHTVDVEAKLAAAAEEWQKAHLIVDAMLGTGFTGNVRGLMAAAIADVNQAHEMGASVLAVDVPSGLDCDTGKPSNATIKANRTVTFVGEKLGFAAESAKEYVGEVQVAGIGVPEWLVDEV